MPVPYDGTVIGEATQALAATLARELWIVGFLAAPDGLHLDPVAAVEDLDNPDVDDLPGLQRAAFLITTQTRPVRATMGSGHPRYVVERTCQLDLHVYGQTFEAAGRPLLVAALSACARLPESDPTLGGAAERLYLTETTPDELPPLGLRQTLTFVIRVRSSDALGLSA